MLRFPPLNVRGRGRRGRAQAGWIVPLRDGGQVVVRRNRGAGGWFTPVTVSGGADKVKEMLSAGCLVERPTLVIRMGCRSLVLGRLAPRFETAADLGLEPAVNRLVIAALLRQVTLPRATAREIVAV